MSRVERVAQQLKREISRLLLLEIMDPRIGFLTITQVKISSDLKIARIYYTTLGDEESKNKTQEGLEKASGYIRKCIAQRVKLKFVPEIEFYYDEELTRALKLEKILDELENEGNSKT